MPSLNSLTDIILYTIVNLIFGMTMILFYMNRTETKLSSYKFLFNCIFNFIIGVILFNGLLYITNINNLIGKIKTI